MNIDDLNMMEANIHFASKQISKSLEVIQRRCPSLSKMDDLLLQAHLKRIEAAVETIGNEVDKVGSD